MSLVLLRFIDYCSCLTPPFVARKIIAVGDHTFKKKRRRRGKRRRIIKQRTRRSRRKIRGRRSRRKRQNGARADRS